MPTRGWLMSEIYSHLLRNMMPAATKKHQQPAAPPATSVPSPKADANQQALAAARQDLALCTAELATERERRASADATIAELREDLRQAESRYLQEAVRRGEAEGAKKSLEVALHEAQVI